MMRFSDRVAVVTGAAEGIGLEIASQLAGEGAAVLLNDIDLPKAEKAAAEIRSRGGSCVAAGGDVAEVDVVRGLVDHAVRAFGRLDFAVANAGYSLAGNFFDMTLEDFSRVVHVNLAGTFFLAQAAARRMLEQGEGGRLLFMSSVMGHQAFVEGTLYGMTKRGIEMLARSIGVVLAPHKITVNAIAPGATATPRTIGNDPAYLAKWADVTPARQLAYPADVANAALFFLSPESAHITGQTILVDGGWTLISPIP